MALLFSESFEQYRPVANDLDAKFDGVGNLFVQDIGGGILLTPGNTNISAAIHETGNVRFSTELQYSGSSTNIGFGDAALPLSSRTTALSGARFSLVNGFLQFRYTLFQNLGSSAGAQSIIFESQNLINSGSVYLELEVDHRDGVTGHTRAYVNGSLEIDATYSLTEINGVTGIPLTDIGFFSFAGNTGFKHIITWDNQPGGLDVFPTPTGLTIETLRAADAGGVLDDTADSGISVNFAVPELYEFADFSDPAATVYGAKLVYRAAARGGAIPSTVNLAVDVGGQEVGSVQREFPAGFAFRPAEVELQDGLTVADLNAARLVLSNPGA